MKSFSDSFIISSPSRKISPFVIFPGYDIFRIIDEASVLLPQPDSPAIPRDSPYFKFKETLSTALIVLSDKVYEMLNLEITSLFCIRFYK